MLKRETNIELLRIICMIMIVFLHILLFTEVLYSYREPSFKSAFVWILEALCFVAVDCYVLISSYFLIDKKFSIRRIIKLWIQVFFYSITLLIVMTLVFKVQVDKVDILNSIFPILFKNYWFPTIYIGLCILSPFINIFIKNLTKKQYEILLIITTFLFSIWPFAIQCSSNLEFGGAYSITWFINLYLISGYLKLHFDIKKCKNSKYLLIYFISCILLYLIFLFIIYFKIPYFSADYFYSYNFILVLIASVSLFIYFKNLKIKSNVFNKIILFFSPLTFGVYLIHENPLVRNKLWDEVAKLISDKYFYVNIIILGIIVFILCSMIDYIRKLIFKPIDKKIMNNKFLNKIDSKF